MGRSRATAGPCRNVIWSLNPNAQGAITVNGTADVDLGCGVIANSDDVDGLHQEGSGCLAATKLKVAGGSTAD